MFPQKQLPDIPDEPAPVKSDDFLDKHSGKLAAAVLSAIAALIYWWIRGSRNRTELEEMINDESPLHPYESAELRTMNSLTCDQYLDFVRSCLQNFPSHRVTYKDFIRFFNEQTQYTVKGGYIIDRIVMTYREEHQLGEDAELPLGFLLTVLSNVTNSSPLDRAEILFDVARGSGSVDDEEGLYCSNEQASTLVGHLMSAWQVPAEIRIKETGVKLPFKTYEQKSSSEMVEQGVAKMKPPPHKENYFSRNEFAELILGSVVCAWGECYRNKGK